MPLPGALLSSQSHNTALVSSGALGSYLQPGLISSRPEGSFSRKRLGFTPLCLPSLLPPAQSRHSLLLEESFSPTYPSINNFCLKDCLSHVQSIWQLRRFFHEPLLIWPEWDGGSFRLFDKGARWDSQKLRDTSPRSRRWGSLNCLRTSS